MLTLRRGRVTAVVDRADGLSRLEVDGEPCGELVVALAAERAGKQQLEPGGPDTAVRDHLGQQLLGSGAVAFPAEHRGAHEDRAEPQQLEAMVGGERTGPRERLVGHRKVAGTVVGRMTGRKHDASVRLAVAAATPGVVVASDARSPQRV